MIPAPVSRPPTPLQIAGAGSARHLAAGFRDTKSVLVVDPAVMGRAERLLAGGFLWLETAPPVVSAEHAAGFGRRLRERGVERVLSVGGGHTMDFAKLAVSMAADPLVESVVTRSGGPAGVVVLPRPLSSHIEVSAIPTTFGTGSEVTSGACFESAGPADGHGGFRAKSLVLLEGLKTSAVAYDPEFLEAPPWLIAEGLLEPAVRLLTSLVEGTPDLAYSDAQGSWLLAEAGEHLAAGQKTDFRLSPSERVDAALLSAESHAGWSLRGRGPAPSSLWFPANELSMALGLRKNQASALLLRPWLEAVGNGKAAWGNQRKLDELWPLVSVGAAAAVTATLKGPDGGALVGGLAGGDGMQVDDLADSLATRTLGRFGRGRPMKRAVGHGELVDLFAAALSPANFQQAGLQQTGSDSYGR